MALERVGEAAQFNRTSPAIYVKSSMGSSNPKAPKQRINQSIRIISLSYEDGILGTFGNKGSPSAKKVNKLVLEVENFNLRNHEDFTFRPGGSLDVQWGYPGRMGPQRHCCITKVTGDHKLKVECRARSILMHRESKARNFINMKHSEIFAMVAKENGYADADMDIEDTEIRYGVVNQAGLTDHQFLIQLAEEEGFEYFDDTGATGLHFRRPTFGGMPVREFRYFTNPVVGEVEKFATDGSVTAKVSSVMVKSIDPKTKKVVTATAGNSATSRSVTGRDINAEDKTLGVAYQTQINNPAAAKRTADKIYLGASRSSIKLKEDIIGDAQLLAKTVIKVTGISKRLDGLFYIVGIKHSIKAGHFKMTLECRTDAGTTAATTPSKGKRATAAADPGEAKELNINPEKKTYTTGWGRTRASEDKPR